MADYKEIRERVFKEDGTGYPAVSFVDMELLPAFMEAREYRVDPLRVTNEAQVAMLVKQKIISPDHAKVILAAIEDLDYGKYRTMDYDGKHEDLFFMIEDELISKTGGLAGSIHIARSRNDLSVALDHLMLRKLVLNAIRELMGLMDTVRAFAEEHKDTLFPAHTHTQQAQPSVLGHYFLGYTDVLNRDVLVSNRETILRDCGRIDVLLNAAGGNMGGATIAPDKSFLDLEIEAFKRVVDLNLFGTVLPTTVFGEAMTARKKGVIVNFCSESALRPLTRVVGYGAAKAAIGNYTKYMAAELAMKFSPEMRVNAIVPGFLLTNQNRTLLTNPDGSYTDRARTIIAHTPAGRFAEPEELLGTIHYLISDASSFVTGALAVVDGGFDAFSI